MLRRFLFLVFLLLLLLACCGCNSPERVRLRDSLEANSNRVRVLLVTGTNGGFLVLFEGVVDQQRASTKVLPGWPLPLPSETWQVEYLPSADLCRAVKFLHRCE